MTGLLGVLVISTSSQEHRELTGERLKKLRTKKKHAMKINGEGLLTMEKISSSLGISRATYADWEQGRRSPRGENLLNVAKYFNTTVDYITGHTDDDSPRNENEIFVDEHTPVVVDGVQLSDKQRKELYDFINKLTSNIED
jgi:transcriptional regulator with XRE-family HTH domain